MKSAARFALVMVAAPDLKIARKLARAALKARLVACVNIIPKLESHYWWKGKIESGAEALLIMKTSRKNLAALEKLVLAGHPYDTPEFVVISLTTGNARYLKWITDSMSR